MKSRRRRFLPRRQGRHGDMVASVLGGRTNPARRAARAAIVLPECLVRLRGKTSASLRQSVFETAFEVRTKLGYGLRPLLQIGSYPLEKRHAFLDCPGTGVGHWGKITPTVRLDRQRAHLPSRETAPAAAILIGV
jgi:hypothetical protein